MPIRWSCSECGKHLRAPEGAEGRKCRCPDCGNVTTVPNAEPAPLPSASREATAVGGDAPDAEIIKTGCPNCDANYRVRATLVGRYVKCKRCEQQFVIAARTLPAPSAPPPTAAAAQAGEMPDAKTVPPDTAEMGRPPRRSHVRLIVPYGVVAVLLAGAVYGGLRIKASLDGAREGRERGRRELIAQVTNAINMAEGFATRFDFDLARTTLRAAEQQLEDSELANIETYDALRGEIREAREQLATRLDDHRAKLRRGWVVFEGEVMPPEKRGRILVERRARVDKARRSGNWELIGDYFGRALADNDTESAGDLLLVLLGLMRGETLAETPEVHDRDSCLTAADAFLEELNRIQPLTRKLMEAWPRAMSDRAGDGVTVTEQALAALEEYFRAIEAYAQNPKDEALKKACVEKARRHEELTANAMGDFGGALDTEIALAKAYFEFTSQQFDTWWRRNLCIGEMAQLALQAQICPRCKGAGQLRRSDDEMRQAASAAVGAALAGGRTTRVISRYYKCTHCDGVGRLWSWEALAREQKVFAVWNRIPTNHALLSDLIGKVRRIRDSESLP